MLRVASLVAVLTVLSKILGLARDLVIAHYFGTSVVSDAFNMAYLFTGNFFIIFGCIGGPFYSAVVATLPKLQAGAWNFIRAILLRSFVFLLGITAAIYFFKSQLLSFFIDPVTKPEYYSLTLFHLDYLLPMIILCAPIGIIAAVLNSYKKYIEPSLAPAVVNLSLIVAVFVLGDAYNGVALALGTGLGAVLSVLFQLPTLFKIRANELIKGVQELKFQLKDYHHILFPALISTGISQAMVFVDSFFCADLSEGSWTAVVMANRLVQMPLGVLLTAFLVPVFPHISELAAKSEFNLMRQQIKKALFYIFLMAVPAVLIGLFWTEEIISLLFERGAFDARSTALVASVFFYLCIAILPMILRDSLTRIFYSLGDARMPLYVAVFAVLLKIALNSIFVPQMAAAGVALSTLIMSSVNVILLFLLLYFSQKKFFSN